MYTHLVSYKKSAELLKRKDLTERRPYSVGNV